MNEVMEDLTERLAKAWVILALTGKRFDAEKPHRRSTTKLDSDRTFLFPPF